MSKSLVTGGSGFLGSHLVEALVARGEKVRVLVRPTSKVAHLESLKVELIYGDLNNIQSLRKAIQNIERVYHCAALATDWGTWERFRSTNITGVHNLLEAALEAGVKKFIHVSTTDVYGHPDYPVDETTPYRLRGWPYGDTKIEGEQLVWTYYKKHNLPITIVRPVNIYGPRSITFVSNIVELLKSGSMIHIGNEGKPAGLAYVTNVVDVILRTADSKQSVGQAYNASDGSDVTWAAVCGSIGKDCRRVQSKNSSSLSVVLSDGWVMEKLYRVLQIKGRPLLTRMAAELFGTNQGFLINKARRELGYEPEIDFDEGMRRVEVWLH